MAELGEWANLYVIVGSSAGALIALLFVVMTLLAERPPQRAAEASAALATPNVVHFAAVLLLFGGVHNAWDGAAYQVLSSKRDGDPS